MNSIKPKAPSAPSTPRGFESPVQREWTQEEEKMLPKNLHSLPHLNPFFDIPSAIEYLRPPPLRMSYFHSHQGEEIEKKRVEKLAVIDQAVSELQSRQDRSFIGIFHSLAKNYLKERRKIVLSASKQIVVLTSPRASNKKSLLHQPSTPRPSVKAVECSVVHDIFQQENNDSEYLESFHTQSLLYLARIAEVQAEETARRKAAPPPKINAVAEAAAQRLKKTVKKN